MLAVLPGPQALARSKKMEAQKRETGAREEKRACKDINLTICKKFTMKAVKAHTSNDKRAAVSHQTIW